MIEAGLLVLGILAHWLKKLMEARQTTGEIPNPLDLFWAQPYKVVYSILMSVAAAYVMFDLGMLNGATAFFLGFSADSAAAAIKRRANV